MAYGPYLVSKAQWAWRNELLSGSFRDADGDSTKDEANLATDTFYHLPVFIGKDNMVIEYQLREYIKRMGGSRYTTTMRRGGAFTPPLTFTGPVVDHSWLHQVTGAVETADDTPGAGFYTHQHDHAHTPNATEPSIELLCRIPNAGTGAALVLLFVGSIIPSYEETLTLGLGPEFPEMQGTYIVNVAKVVAGTDLNTWPTYPDKDAFDQSHMSYTFNDGGVAINAVIKSYTYRYDTDRRFSAGNGEYNPGRVYGPNSAESILELVLEDFDNNLSKYLQDPDDANDLDFKLTFTRTTNEDSWEIKYDNAIYTLKGLAFGEQLETTITVEYNPKEASALHQLTEINNLTDDRYET